MTQITRSAITTPSEVLFPDDLLLDMETSHRLRELGAMLLPPPIPEDKRPLPHREYERRYREWRKNPPEKIVNKANMIGVNNGIWAVDPYYREVFASLHPEWTPQGRVGRAPGYSPAKQLRIAKGTIIRRLLELSGDALRTELESSTREE